MDLYNSCVDNVEIDFGNAGVMGRTTHIYKVWADSLGDVHLDVRIDCTDKDGTKGQWIIPNLCIPMDGVIRLNTTKDSKYCMGVSTRAWFELRRDITLRQGYSESLFAPSKKTSLPYCVIFQLPDSSVKKMTLE